MTDTELKDLMERAIQPLEPMPDAVPEVLVTGRRSIRRRRALAAGTAVLGTAATVVAVTGLVSLTGASNGTEAPAAGPGTALTPTPTASTTAPARPSTRSTEHSDQPGSRKSATPWNPPAELVAFNRGVVVPAIDRALPSRFGTVRTDGEVGRFTISNGGKKYEAQFYVVNRPAGYPEQIFSCDKYTDPLPGEPDRFASCTQRVLPDGMRAVAVNEDISQTAEDLVALRALTIYRDKLVELSLYPSETEPRAVPITRAEMLDALEGLAATYHEWATRPGWTN
jgi:hypothetical protein